MSKLFIKEQQNYYTIFQATCQGPVFFFIISQKSAYFAVFYLFFCIDLSIQIYIMLKLANFFKNSSNLSPLNGIYTPTYPQFV